jgi:hypothetical protein
MKLGVEWPKGRFDPLRLASGHHIPLTFSPGHFPQRDFLLAFHLRRVFGGPSEAARNGEAVDGFLRPPAIRLRTSGR